MKVLRAATDIRALPNVWRRRFLSMVEGPRPMARCIFWEAEIK